MIAAGLCFLGGLALTAGGLFMVRKNGVQPGESVFMSFFSPRSLAIMAGWIAAFLGLLLAFIGAPMVYLTP